MRGEDRTNGALFSYLDVEGRIPAKHPLRAMRWLTNAALAELDARFSALYEGIGRPSIPPERLLRASLLQRGDDQADASRRAGRVRVAVSFFKTAILRAQPRSEDDLTVSQSRLTGSAGEDGESKSRTDGMFTPLRRFGVSKRSGAANDRGGGRRPEAPPVKRVGRPRVHEEDFAPQR